MKTYKKVELVAKNQIAGSYAAGCPANSGVAGNCAAGSNRRHCELGR